MAAEKTWAMLSGARCAGLPRGRACLAETASATGLRSMGCWDAGWKCGACYLTPHTPSLSRHSTVCLSSAAKTLPVKVSTSPQAMMVRGGNQEEELYVVEFYVIFIILLPFVQCHCWCLWFSRRTPQRAAWLWTGLSQLNHPTTFCSISYATARR